jgi:hypothetical protein
MGSNQEKGVGYALVEATLMTFFWSAASEAIDGSPMHIDWYRTDIERRSRNSSTYCIDQGRAGKANPEL